MFSPSSSTTHAADTIITVAQDDVGIFDGHLARQRKEILVDCLLWLVRGENNTGGSAHKRPVICSLFLSPTMTRERGKEDIDGIQQ